MRLLEQAGYADGRDPESGGPLILYYDTPAAGPDSKAMLQWYRKQLAKLGIELVIRATDYNRFQDKMLKGTAQIFSWGWNADYPDPENFFFLLYGPNGKVEFKGENAANFTNAEFDALFLQMKDLPNGPSARQVIDRMVDILRQRVSVAVRLLPQGLQSASRLVPECQTAPDGQQHAQVQTRRRCDARGRAEGLEPAGAVAGDPAVRAAACFAGSGDSRLSRARKEQGTVIAYIIRRLLYALPILIGVNALTFVLFFVVNSPDDMARMHLGNKRVTDEAIQTWKQEHGYEKPLLINTPSTGSAAFTDTILFEKSLKLFLFDFGQSDSGRDISHDISQRMWPSLAIAVPTLLVGLAVNITFALLLAFFRASYLDFWGVVMCVAHDVHLESFLHHRRPVPGRQTAQPGADLRLRHGRACLEVHDPAGDRRRDRRHRFRHALVPHAVSRRDPPGLCALGARQGAVRAVGAVPSCVAQCADSDPDRRGRGSCRCCSSAAC